MNVLIGCECSGVVRDAFRARGHNASSCDLKPTRRAGRHFQMDLIRAIGESERWGIKWDLLIAHPDCTYLTSSAEWAYKDPDFERYPGVGYHQKLKPGTLFGAARRQARKEAVDFVFALRDCGIPRIAIENPTGHLSRAWRKADQTIQPYDFGDDASKGTGLWLINLPRLVLDPAKRVRGRFVRDPNTGKIVERWANQTDSGQNNIGPRAGRDETRSTTYQGIANAMAEQWGGRIGDDELEDRK